MMDAGLATIICAAITAAGTVAVAKVGTRSKAENQEIMERLARVEQRQACEALISERNDLLMAIRTDSDNTEEIMNIAKHYFLDLGGNSYASRPFAVWALTHRIEISKLYTEHNDLEFYMKNPEVAMKKV